MRHKLTKKALSLLVTLAMLLSMVPVAYADEGKPDECTNDDNCTVHEAALLRGESVTHYATLTDAINNAQAGDTITVLKDVDYASSSEKFNLSGKTLNLGGHELKTGGELAFYGTSAKIKNGTMTGDNSVYYTEAIKLGASEGYTEICIENVTANGGLWAWWSAVTLNNVTIIDNGHHPTVNASSADVTINGGTYKASSNNRLFNTDNCTITVIDGNFEGELINAEDGNINLTITGGNFKNDPSYYVTASAEVRDQGDGAGYRYQVVTPQVAAVVHSDDTTTTYTNLSGAINAAAAGETVKLLADVTGASTITINKDLTLDLNGKSIRCSGTGNWDYTVNVKNGTVIIKNSGGTPSTIEQTVGNRALWISGGKVTLGSGVTVTSRGYAMCVCDTGKFILNGGTVHSDEEYGIYEMMYSADKAPAVIIERGTVEAPASTGDGIGIVITGYDSSTYAPILTVNGGTVSGGYIAISGNGNTRKGNTVINITGGTVKGGIIGIYHPQAGTLTLKGGEITGGTGIYAKSGTVTVPADSAVKVQGTGESAEYEYQTSGCVSTGDALVLESCGYPGGLVSAAIAGGTFTSTYADAVAAYAQEGYSALTGFITGGTYSSDPSDYVATGYEAVKNADGTYTVQAAGSAVASIGDAKYATLQAAVDAATNGETIVLINSVTGYGIVASKNQNFVLDLNGKTYTVNKSVGSTGTETNAMQLLKGAKVTIKNGSIEFLASKIGIKNYCDLTLENVKITNAGSSNPVINNCGQLTVNGTDTEITGGYKWAITTGNYAKGDVITTTINAGTISSVANETPLWETGGATVNESVTTTINGGTIGTLGIYDWRSDYTGYDDAPMLTNWKMIVKGGTISELAFDEDSVGKVAISGGLFSEQVPAEYCAENYQPTTVPVDDYYTVELKEVIHKPTVPSVEQPADNADQSVKDVVQKLESVTDSIISGTGLTEAAQKQVEANQVTADQGKTKLENEVLGSTTEKDVKIVLQSYTDIQVKSVTTGTTETGTIKSMKLEITPKIRTVATTATGNEAITIGTNAVVMKDAENLDITGTVTVTLPVPENFVASTETKNVKVLHTKADGARYVYDGTVTNGILSFENPNGFSTFEVYGADEVIPSAEAKVTYADGTITEFTTLAQAIDAVPTDGTETTITLLDNVEFTGDIEVDGGKNITLNLNDHSVISNNDYVFKVTNAKFHVTGTGTICENIDFGYAPICALGSYTDVANYTVITIDKDVTLKGDYAGIFVGGDTNYGLVVNMSGTIDTTGIVDGTQEGSGIYVNGQNQVTTGNVMQFNLNGATIRGSSEDGGIYAAGYAKWNLTDCTIIEEKSTAIEIRAGEMTINGGTYTSNAAEFKCEADGNGATTIGAAIAIAQHTTKKNIKVTINGGTFTGVKALNESNPQENDPAPQVDLTVTGGMFNGEITTADVKSFISGGTFDNLPAEAYIATGYEAVEQSTAPVTWIVQLKADVEAFIVGTDQAGSLQAMLDAATSGQTVQMLTDVTASGLTYVPANVTLDLNGQTLNADILYGIGNVIDSTEGSGKLTISDTNSSLSSNNTSLAVWDVDGYRLYSYRAEHFLDGYHKINSNSAMFSFGLAFKNSEAWTKIAADNDTVKLSYSADWGAVTKPIFEFQKATVDGVVSKGPQDDQLAYCNMTVAGLQTILGETFKMTPQIQCALFTKSLTTVNYSVTE